MVTILRGPDHKVNTRELLSRLLRRTAAGEAGQILLVPEQYSFDMERTLCRMGGESVSRYAEVLSFTRLADRVERQYGGGARTWLDPGGRLLAAAQAADQVQSRLKRYAAVCQKPEFLEMFLNLTEEMGSYGVTPARLMESARRQTGRFAQKLEELSLLMESYGAVTARAGDPIARLQHLLRILEQEDYAESKTFYVCGFQDFTALEREILEQVFLSARDVTVALPWEPDRTSDAFASSDETAAQIRRFCDRNNLPVRTETLDFDRLAPEDLLLAQTMVSRPVADGSAEKAEHLLCVKADDPDGLCRAAASRIWQLVRSGARFRQIAVACADGDLIPTLRSVLRRAEIPCFLSGRQPLSEHPGAKMLLFALRAAAFGMEREDVTDYLKTGAAGLDDDACDRLENYAILWNIHGSRWETAWTLHPRMLTDRWDDRDRETLDRLNRWRAEGIGPLRSLRMGLQKAETVGQMARAAYDYLEGIDHAGKMEAEAQRFFREGDLTQSQQYAQIYDVLMDALEQTDLILGHCVRTPEEFCRLMEKLLAAYSVGAVPASADEVTVGSVGQMRGRPVEHLLILGADEQHFPAVPQAAGLFTEEERQRLMADGLPMAPLRADAMGRELGSVYQAIRSAKTTLALYCAGTPSYLMTRIAGVAGGIRELQAQIPLDPAEAAAMALRDGRSLPENGETNKLAEELDRRRRYTFGAVDEPGVKILYGEEYALSASKVDQFAACRFAFFLRYGLRAKPREEAKFNAAAFGTFVHDVLETTANEVMARGGFHAVTPEQVTQIAGEAADAYVRQALKDLTENETRFAVQFEQNRQEALAVAEDLAEEMRLSEFTPFACELRFAKDGAMPPVAVSGQRAVGAVSGAVDRADLYRRDGKTYVRVVDYKTGRKDFDYADLTVGEGMQMLIYLFALKRHGKEAFGEEFCPAGVLYLPARRDVLTCDDRPTPEEAADRHAKAVRRKGLILRDDGIISAMEGFESSPRYLPLKVSAKSGVTGELADREQMELLERYVFFQLGRIADEIAGGDVTPDPVIRGAMNSACTYCDYRSVCQKGLAKHRERRMREIDNKAFFETLTRWEAEHGNGTTD